MCRQVITTTDNQKIELWAQKRPLSSSSPCPKRLVFASVISMLSVISPELLAICVRRPRCHFRLSISVAFIWDTSSELASSETSLLSLDLFGHISLQFLPCDAQRCTVFEIVILSVCLSVCPSVTLVDCVHMV